MSYYHSQKQCSDHIDASERIYEISNLFEKMRTLDNTILELEG